MISDKEPKPKPKPKSEITLDEKTQKRIQERKNKIREMKIEQKILHLQSKLKKNKNKIKDLDNLSLVKQYKIEDLESEIYNLKNGENVDDKRLNDNDDELDESIIIE